MALRGVKVLEFVGLAPGPFCGKVLADFGATVTRIDRSFNNSMDCLMQGKRTLALNIKNSKSQELIKDLCKEYDVLLEPFRPGVLEKYNLGPKELAAINPKLIYARLTGFGQNGPLSKRAGHDINYVGLSGVLSMLGRKDDKPTAPINLIADFAGGGLLCAFGICLALLERQKSGKGQIVDNSMVEGSAYISSWLLMSQEKLPIWGKPRGENIIDTGAFFYDVYKTKDEKYMSVGALEPEFFEKFINGLNLSHLTQYDNTEEAKRQVTEKFLTKTQHEWCKIFNEIDACVFPVVEWKDAPENEHNEVRKSFKRSTVDGTIIPTPAPRLSRTPGEVSERNCEQSVHSMVVEILKEIGKTEAEITKMIEEQTILVPKAKL